MTFYKCAKCGAIATYVAGKCELKCCNEPMTELTANTTDAAAEKHVPVITADKNTVHVEIGSVAHPMLEQHYIQFIAVETSTGFQFKNLKPGEAAAADFALAEGDALLAAYEYCNLHGLWMTKA